VRAAAHRAPVGLRGARCPACNTAPCPSARSSNAGPRTKRSVAFSIDWPGWSRGAKSAELVLETLEATGSVTRPVADLAGMAGEFAAAGPLVIVEEKVGTGSTDSGAYPFSPSATEQGPMGEAELGAFHQAICGPAGRSLTLSRPRVSPEMRKGPRGGGRDGTGSSATPSAPKARTSPSRWGCGYRRARRLPRMDCGGIGRPTSRRCVPKRRGGHAAHAVVDATVPYPTLRLSHARPCWRWRTRTSPLRAA